MLYTRALLQLPLLLLCGGGALAVDPTVKLSYATYQGTAQSNGVTKWLGIRYAAPPLGDLRFAAPQDPLKESATVVADQVSSVHFDIRYSKSDRNRPMLIVYPPYSMANTVLQPVLRPPTTPPPKTASSSTSTLPPMRKTFLCISSFKVAASTRTRTQTTTGAAWSWLHLAKSSS